MRPTHWYCYIRNVRPISLVTYVRPNGLVTNVRPIGVVINVRPIGLVTYVRPIGLVTNVRPIIEFASCVWSPCRITDIIKTSEPVQRRFTKRLPGLQESEYSERLEIFGRKRYEHQRLKLDLKFVLKVVTFGLVDVDQSKFCYFV